MCTLNHGTETFACLRGFWLNSTHSELPLFTVALKLATSNETTLTSANSRHGECVLALSGPSSPKFWSCTFVHDYTKRPQKRCLEILIRKSYG